MPSLKALPGRAVMKFPSATAQIGAIYIPETSQLRPEFAEIYDIGEPATEEDVVYRRALLELKKAGIPVAVSYMAGVSYWKEGYDPKEYGWLRDFRVFTLREAASYLDQEEVIIDGSASAKVAE